MVVECPECGTRFSLDESRITGATAMVRCSQCHQVFRINRAGQVVERAAAPPAEAPPIPPPQEVGEAPPEQAPEVTPETPPEAPSEAPPEVPPDAPAEAPPDAPSEAPPEERPSPRIVREEAEAPPAPETEELPLAAGGFEAREETAPEAPEGPPAEAPARPRPRLRLWMVAVMLAVPILAALGWWIWQWQQPEQIAPGSPAGPSAPAPLVVTPSPPPVPAADLRDLPVAWAQARYEGLVNDQGEQLLVIRGEVANEGKAARGPIRLKATLTDARHQPLKEKMAYAGTTLTDKEVKTLDPEKIKGWLDQPGGRSEKQELKPGEKQPFTVVFFGVPANLAETQAGFQLVVVEGPASGGKSGQK